MMEAVIPVRLSASLLEDVSQEAQRNSMSAEEWLVWVAAERLREKEATERFFSRAPQDSDGRRILEILRSSRGNEPPVDGDEL